MSHKDGHFLAIRKRPLPLGRSAGLSLLCGRYSCMAFQQEPVHYSCGRIDTLLWRPKEEGEVTTVRHTMLHSSLGDC